MAPLFAKDMTFEIAGLESVDGLIGVPTPKILHKGVLESWRCIIVSHVEGQRMGDVFSSLSSEHQIDLASKIAHVTRAINLVPPNQVIRDRGDWN